MPREETLRAYFVRRVRQVGGVNYKLSPNGRRGKPDELTLLPWRLPALVELKKRGEKPEPHQLREHERLGRIGHRVVVIDCKRKVDQFLTHEYTSP